LLSHKSLASACWQAGLLFPGIITILPPRRLVILFYSAYYTRI